MLTKLVTVAPRQLYVTRLDNEQPIAQLDAIDGQWHIHFLDMLVMARDLTPFNSIDLAHLYIDEIWYQHINEGVTE